MSDQPVAKLCYHSCSVDILEELLVILDHQRVQVILKAFESGEEYVLEVEPSHVREDN